MKPLHRAPGPRSQRGLSLITALLFMVAALILGVSVIGINAMQERMIGNTKDRALALQAAEAALRDAELDIVTNINPISGFNDECGEGLCTPPSQRATPSPLGVHEQPGFTWAWTEEPPKVRKYGKYTGKADFPQVASPPVYVIEKLGSMGVPPGESEVDGAGSARTGYRITARATGAQASTVVVLQSIFSK